MKRSYLIPDLVSPTGGPVPLLDGLTGRPVTDSVSCRVHDLLRAHIRNATFPCSVGKRSFARGFYRLGIYVSMTDHDSIDGLARDLWRFVNDQPSLKGPSPDDYSTFIAVFADPIPKDELEFESLLWEMLQKLHDEDATQFQWDQSVQSDPDDPNFGYSIGGQAFFLVGMHEKSSRISRRFVYPAVAFNSHHQFQDLRNRGKFDLVQKTIRALDTKIQGSINPSLTNFGADSEAKQYSGREVEPSWKCPFHK